jgi:peroxiredoxin
MISLDESTELVQQFLKNEELNLPIKLMDSGWAFADVSAGTPIQILMPSTYIIDKKGKIRYKHIGAADWNTPKIKDFLLSLAIE